MSSKRHIRETKRRKSCEGKVKYAQIEAQRRAKKRSKTDLKFNAYRCKFCGSWHVGHMPMRILNKIFLKGT